MNMKTNVKSIGVLILFQCLQLGICLPQGFFSGISPFSSKRTNDNSRNIPFNIRLKSSVAEFLGRHKIRQNQYPIQSDYNKQNSYDDYKTSNGYQKEFETKEVIDYQNKNEEQNKVEVLSRTGAFDDYKSAQNNIGQDSYYGKQIEEANEIESDKTTELSDIETTTSTEDYETTTDDYGLGVRINSNVVASLLG